MRLIDKSTPQLKELDNSSKPAYAILSHIWTGEEISFDEMLCPTTETQRKAGFLKIKGCCDMAKGHGLSCMHGSTHAARYSPTGDNALRKGRYLPLKTTGVVTRLYMPNLVVFLIPYSVVFLSKNPCSIDANIPNERT